MFVVDTNKKGAILDFKGSRRILHDSDNVMLRESKTMETVKASGVAGHHKDGGMSRWDIGVWGYETILCLVLQRQIRVSLYICQNSQNEQYQECILR